ncbi:hypothetical protein AAG570_011174 [Ranatra chinensis]|uniref:CCAAT-binding factor domain-containing protein n=1 Tax=Ranatra chinensis TaxID=642074 RepID=A0ABD0YY65_9HEMI
MTVDLKPTTKQKLLVVLIEQLMPRMENPIFLTDYFMSCLDEGGAISLLGLQGIFNLIQKHNINYPNIYNKLYSLLAADIFSTTYKARFFYLSDIFLTSTHLPEAMVAGFVKKLARLSLMAPPGDIIMMMAFIKNLIIRHPGLKKMLRHSPGQDVKTDPYIFEEADPSKSRAIDSSLWEVQLLQHHVLPGVAASAMFISKPLSPTETDLGDLLEVTTEEVSPK